MDAVTMLSPSAGTDLRELDGDDFGYLRRNDRPDWSAGGCLVRVVDLFSGVGGLSLGLVEAARSLGRAAEVALAVDLDPVAVACFERNLPVHEPRVASVTDVFSPRFQARRTASERRLEREGGSVDVLVGGPPCQGHSDLNNYSRRDDPKNALYVCMARAARILEPRHVVVENVAGAVHDRGGVVQQTADALDRLGYRIVSGVVEALELGAPQRRRRHLLIASRKAVPEVETIVAAQRCEPRDLRWAIGDLEDEPGTSPFTTPSTPSPDNRRRIDHLFEHGLHDLPDDQRPPCHRDKPHTYRSVYGRLRWDRPTQTITSGFYSTCMGRYVHPSRRRTLTAHEAARVQFFPDWFDFSPAPRRTALARLVGNAVPMKIAYALGRALLGGLDAEDAA